MPMRDDASYCRPRLYDAEDPERDDDVSEILSALDAVLDRAMDDGDKEKVAHLSDLIDRIASSAGGKYEEYTKREADEVGG
jgi:hypothetical protein